MLKAAGTAAGQGAHNAVLHILGGLEVWVPGTRCRRGRAAGHIIRRLDSPAGRKWGLPPVWAPVVGLEGWKQRLGLPLAVSEPLPRSWPCLVQPVAMRQPELAGFRVAPITGLVT